jgi:hypothetical protein
MMVIYRYVYHFWGINMASKRTIITISEEDKRWLESYSSLHKVSVAEAIRQGIRKLKEVELLENYQSLVNNTTGLWKKGDGLAYQKKIRAEWNSQ